MTRLWVRFLLLYCLISAHRSTDLDTFLPSAIQRYHQLFMPTLQLVNAMLATLGNKHATASNQVRHLSLSVLIASNRQIHKSIGSRLPITAQRHDSDYASKRPR